MNNNKIQYVWLVFIFSIILFGSLSFFFGSEDLVRDFLLSILIVSYILKNVLLDKS